MPFSSRFMVSQNTFFTGKRTLRPSVAPFVLRTATAERQQRVRRGRGVPTILGLLQQVGQEGGHCTRALPQISEVSELGANSCYSYTTTLHTCIISVSLPRRQMSSYKSWQLGASNWNSGPIHKTQNIYIPLQRIVDRTIRSACYDTTSYRVMVHSTHYVFSFKNF